MTHFSIYIVKITSRGVKRGTKWVQDRKKPYAETIKIVIFAVITNLCIKQNISCIQF